MSQFSLYGHVDYGPFFKFREAVNHSITWEQRQEASSQQSSMTLLQMPLVLFEGSQWIQKGEEGFTVANHASVTLRTCAFLYYSASVVCSVAAWTRDPIRFTRTVIVASRTLFSLLMKHCQGTSAKKKMKSAIFLRPVYYQWNDGQTMEVELIV
jgi:hypothetical protein